MKIIFEIANMHAYRLDMMYAGKAPALARRVVSIELTPEQVEKLDLKKVGYDSGADVYEEIMALYLEESR